jgi:hypothetical protein
MLAGRKGQRKAPENNLRGLQLPDATSAEYKSYFTVFPNESGFTVGGGLGKRTYAVE